jgi:carbamoyl-phosphate synthase large subunit
MTSLLVTGAGGSAAANFVRSLRLSGEPFTIVGTDTRAEHLHATPGLDHRYVVPRADDEHYLPTLAALCERHDVLLVHPQPDVEVARLAADGHALPAATFLPDARAVELCHDKLACQRALDAAEVPVPRSVAAPDDEHLAAVIHELAAADPDRRVWTRAVRGAGSRAALPVKTADHAAGWMRYWADMRGLARADFMLCEFLPGREHAFQSLWHDGELVTSAARQRVEYLFGHLTPSGQTSTPSIAVTIDREDVNETAMAAVLAVSERPHGVFCVDMKDDAAGTPRVTEINIGRFFTTSDFFAQAGANMPLSYVRLALGREVGDLPRTNAVPPGRWWVRNIDVPPVLVADGAWDVVDASREPLAK